MSGAASAETDARLAEIARRREAGDLAGARDLAGAALRDAVAAGDDERAVEAGLAGYLLAFTLGDHAGTLETGGILEPLLRARPERRLDLSALWRRMVLSACELGRFELALAVAQSCCEAAREAADDRELALSLAALASCFERMGDPWQAERLMGEGLALAERAEAADARMLLLNNLTAICIGRFHRMRDVDPGDARLAIERAVVHARAVKDMLPAAPDPLFAVFIDGNLGEALLHAGDRDAASPMLQDAFSRSAERGYHAQRWRIGCSIAELDIAEGRPAQALHALDALQAEIAAADQRATLIRLHHARYRAARALGRPEVALAALEAYERLERERATRQLRAQSELFVTRAETDRMRQEALAERERARHFRDEARRDPLTGLANRRALEERLPKLLADAAALQRSATLAVVDIDHFKQVNDRHGHALGDRVLVLVARMLRDGLRQADLLARFGGEEFVVVLFDAAPAVAVEVLDRLRSRVAAHHWGDEAAGLQVTLSIGVAHAPEWALDALFARADAALYRAKGGGRDRLVIADDAG